MKKIIINTDGGSRHNPGESAASFIVFDAENNLLKKGGKALGIATNNEAEYEAVKMALEWVVENEKDLPHLEVEVISDSRLIVEQLRGNFRIKDARMKTYAESIKRIVWQFRDISYTLIPRWKNFLADSIVNEILDNLTLKD